MQKVADLVRTAAPSRINMLLTGESGTGKEVIARAIHDASGRKGLFVPVHCAALPATLLESELFGYEKGAFTGATERHRGRFELADGGTLFLDEIGEIDPATQVKLLRVLENKEIRRVGGVENIPVDVRVICATNNNLEEMIRAKSFREDLYYRLSVFIVKLPSLKDRREDIIPIAEMFLRELNKKYGTCKVLSDLTVNTMLHYFWPGNIRELRNVIERIYVVSPGDELIFTPVPTAEYGAFDFAGRPKSLPLREFGSLKEFVHYAEKEYITRIMEECEGSVNKTAARLGIHRSVLYRKLHK
jgi:transcriptional regulator with PAS, ATPase and Fis domain